MYSQIKLSRFAKYVLLVVLFSLPFMPTSPSHASYSGGTPAASDALIVVGSIERVSVVSDGTQGDGPSTLPSISGDGRYIAFESTARNLVAGDTNGAQDIFVHDRETGITERVSVASDGSQASGGLSYEPAISGDGRYVAFHSLANNLVPGDANSMADVFVHDRETGTTSLVSVASNGTQANTHSFEPSISEDGRYVAFRSPASNLVPGDTGREDIFVHDRITGTTERVSVASDGTPANANSYVPVISGDGRYIAFYSVASNLVSGDTNSVIDVFVHDRITGTTERATVASDGSEANGPSFQYTLSGDGRYVAFRSIASNLVPGDTGAEDIFVRDRVAGTTTLVSVASDGSQASGGLSYEPAISGDGRYVTFGSTASNLFPGDTNGVGDIFVHDRVTGRTRRVSVASDGSQANESSGTSAISSDGRYVTFTSSASNLVPGDTNNTRDVFVVELDEAIYPPADTNLLTNGTFDSGLNNWIIAGDMMASVNEGVLNFVRDGSLGNGWSLLMQDLRYATDAGMPFEISLDLGNAGSTDKLVTVYLHELGTWNEGAVGCVFNILDNSGLDTFTIQGVIPQAWDNLVIEVNTVSPDTPPNYILMDNVNVQYKPSLGSISDVCVAPVPADISLVSNPDFNSFNFNFWAVAGDMVADASTGEMRFVRDASLGNGWALLLQNLNQGVTTGMPFTTSLDLGNATSSTRYVTVYLHDNGTWATALGCVFQIPANAPLQTYSFQGMIPGNWNNITLEIGTLDTDTPPNYILMDNVNVQYQPGLGTPSTECTAPLPVNTNLVRNGDFSDGLNEWAVAGAMEAEVNYEMLDFVRHTGAPNWGLIAQNLNYAISAGTPIELSFDLGSSTGSSVTTSIFLHEANDWSKGNLGCFVQVKQYVPLRRYIIQGVVPQDWTNMTLELNDAINSQIPGSLHLDNVDIRIKPDLEEPYLKCAPVLPEDENLILNPDFGYELHWWKVLGNMEASVNAGVLNFRRPDLGSWGMLLAETGHDVPHGTPFEITLDLGNPSSQEKGVTVYIHSNGVWYYGPIGCWFTLPPNSPLSTYTIRGTTEDMPWSNWSRFVLEINDVGPVTAESLLMDNVNVQYKPSLGSPSNECIPPAAPVVAAVEGDVRIEAEDAAFVTASGEWVQHTSDAASGGAYMYSGGESTDTLALLFSGTQITIVYVQHPALGSFDVYIDGQWVETVSITGVQNFGERVLIADLPEGEHTLTIVPSEGVIAIDAFLLGPD